MKYLTMTPILYQMALMSKILVFIQQHKYPLRGCPTWILNFIIGLKSVTPLK